MAFKLRVQFVGVCLFVQDQAGAVAVVMPDGRTGATPHADNQPLEAHVGYLKVDLRHLAGAPMIADAGRPARPLEVVYRFRRQTVHFALDPAAVACTLEVPDFDAFVPDLALDRAIFEPHAPEEDARGDLVYHPVLMRTLLSGGTLETPDEPDLCGASSIGRWLDLDRPPAPLEPTARAAVDVPAIVGRFYGGATWVREVDAETLTMRITDLDGAHPMESVLAPRDVDGEQVLDVQMGNLCSDNPLVWDDLQFQDAPIEDADFRYLYRLFAPPGDSWYEALQQCMLPTPRLVRAGQQLRGRPPVRCGGGKVRYPGTLGPSGSWDASTVPLPANASD